jgi:hypothetical protein
MHLHKQQQSHWGKVSKASAFLILYKYFLSQICPERQPHFSGIIVLKQYTSSSFH